MFALIQFDDGSYYVCKEKDISMRGNECIIRYRGSRFAGKVLGVNGEYTILAWVPKFDFTGVPILLRCNVIWLSFLFFNQYLPNIYFACP